MRSSVDRTAQKRRRKVVVTEKKSQGGCAMGARGKKKHRLAGETIERGAEECDRGCDREGTADGKDKEATGGREGRVAEGSPEGGRRE